MANVFKPGDVVRLKSGGPNMTVRELYYSTESVFTNWFDDGELQQSMFFTASLEHVPEPLVSDPPSQPLPYSTISTGSTSPTVRTRNFNVSL